jgi:NADH dehydrogenase
MRKPLVVAAAMGGALVSRRLMRSRSDKHWSEHARESEEIYRRANARILVLGSGFGGLTVALHLGQKLKTGEKGSILVIDRNNDLLFTPLLWTVANGRASPNNVVIPIRDFQKSKPFHVRHAEIERIDLDRKEVQTSNGSLPYDILVIALGSHTTVPDFPGLREHVLPFHTPANALQLRNHLIDAIESAHATTDPVARREWLTFVVGGAGDTGVELAAIVHDYLLTGLFKAYPWLAEASVRVVLVGRAKRILPMGDRRTSHLVSHILAQEGIEVLTGESIIGVEETAVLTSSGTIPARTLFWAAGITAPDVVRQLPVPHERNGAVLVDEHLRLPGHPEVYVIGDSAWAYDSITKAPVPPTAQAARQQGHYVGKEIANRCIHQPVLPYRYLPLGHLALLGHATGVARVGPLTFGGLPAWLLWHLVYLLRNPSWKKRIRLGVDWLLSGLLGPEAGQLRLETDLSQDASIPSRWQADRQNGGECVNEDVSISAIKEASDGPRSGSVPPG